MVQWKKDTLYCALIGIFTAIMYHHTLSMDDSLMEYIPAKAGSYTRFWLIVLFILALLIFIRTMKNRDTKVTSSPFHPTSMFTIVTLGLYVFALEYLGYLIATPIYMIGCMVFYTYKARKFVDEDGKKLPNKSIFKSIALMVVGSLLITGATYWLFTEAVGMHMPQFSLW